MSKRYVAILDNVLIPSKEGGSFSYQLAQREGWIEGHAKYALNIPHHGPGYVYANMYHEKREARLVMLFDTKDPVSVEVIARYYPELEDEDAGDYWEKGRWVFLDDQKNEHDVPSDVEFYGDDVPFEVDSNVWEQRVIVVRIKTPEVL